MKDDHSAATLEAALELFKDGHKRVICLKDKKRSLRVAPCFRQKRMVCHTPQQATNFFGVPPVQPEGDGIQ